MLCVFIIRVYCVYVSCVYHVCICIHCVYVCVCMNCVYAYAEPEIAVGHWPFSDQF